MSLVVNGRRAKRQFVVPSESSEREYVVTQYDDPPFDAEHHPEWSCACIGWTRHFPRRECKHILYAQSGGARTFEEAIANRLLGNKLE
jgi:hypothetical protein